MSFNVSIREALLLSRLIFCPKEGAAATCIMQTKHKKKDNFIIRNNLGKMQGNCLHLIAVDFLYI
jgi:hypothetical protein